MPPPSPSSVASGKDGLARMLAAHPQVDAIYCSSDLLALGVVAQARKLGLEVPSRLKVYGFGDLEFAADSLPALLTVRVDGPRIGATAARCLIDRLNGSGGESARVDVGFEIVERETL